MKPAISTAAAKFIRTWNQKNLDYEIETKISHPFSINGCRLEIKRTSITRLKLFLVRYSMWTNLLEIKRTSITRLKLLYNSIILYLVADSLKSKEPRLRDWNIWEADCTRCWCACLKSKEPRLRDWNHKPEPKNRAWCILEIKRTSITRLKPEFI